MFSNLFTARKKKKTKEMIEGMIEANKVLYNSFKAQFPELDNHGLLARVLLVSFDTLGSNIHDTDIGMMSFSETFSFKDIPPPHCINALTFYFIYKVYPELFEICPEYVEEFNNIMRKYSRLDDNFLDTEKTTNPKKQSLKAIDDIPTHFRAKDYDAIIYIVENLPFDTQLDDALLYYVWQSYFFSIPYYDNPISVHTNIAYDEFTDESVLLYMHYCCQSFVYCQLDAYSRLKYYSTDPQEKIIRLSPFTEAQNLLVDLNDIISVWVHLKGVCISRKLESSFEMKINNELYEIMKTFYEIGSASTENDYLYFKLGYEQFYDGIDQLL